MQDKRDLEGLNKKSPSDWKSYFQLGEVATYFRRLFGKRDEKAPNNVNLRIMHGINKISIVIFLLGLIFMITRALLRS